MSHKSRFALALLGIAIGMPASSGLAAEPRADDPVRLTLTSADVRASNEEAAAAYAALVNMWTREFDRVGLPFRAPRIVRYRGNTRTTCGVMPANNAAYCFNNNTIYFDEVFLAAQARITGNALRSDGDMAAVGIIAHEMGHAVAFQLGIRSRSSYRNESIADCLAGAFALSASEDGSLEDGDIEEAFFAMASAADPEFVSTGNPRTDARMAAVLRRQAHGTREQRQDNFERGFSGGAGACISELR